MAIIFHRTQEKELWLAPDPEWALLTWVIDSIWDCVKTQDTFKESDLQWPKFCGLPHKNNFVTKLIVELCISQSTVCLASCQNGKNQMYLDTLLHVLIQHHHCGFSNIHSVSFFVAGCVSLFLWVCPCVFVSISFTLCLCVYFMFLYFIELHTETNSVRVRSDWVTSPLQTVATWSASTTT